MTVAPDDGIETQTIRHVAAGVQYFGLRASTSLAQGRSSRRAWLSFRVEPISGSVNRPFQLATPLRAPASADIAKWHQAEALFRECEFVVASRPGFSLADVANALPEGLRPRQEVTRPFHKQAATGDLVLSGVTIHLLNDVYQPVSSTAIRQAAAAGKALARFVEPAVADYIKKVGLYKGR